MDCRSDVATVPSFEVALVQLQAAHEAELRFSRLRSTSRRSTRPSSPAASRQAHSTLGIIQPLPSCPGPQFQRDLEEALAHLNEAPAVAQCDSRDCCQDNEMMRDRLPPDLFHSGRDSIPGGGSCSSPVRSTSALMAGKHPSGFTSEHSLAFGENRSFGTSALADNRSFASASAFVEEVDEEFSRQVSPSALANWAYLVDSVLAGKGKGEERALKAAARLDLQPVFALRSEHHGARMFSHLANQHSYNPAEEDSEGVDIQLNQQNIMQRLVAHPSSMRSSILGMLACLVFLIDAVVSPLQLVEIGSGLESALLQISKINAAFWLVDLVSNFFTGFETDAWTEMRPMKVAKHYLRTWFLLDFMFVAVDGMYLLGHGEVDIAWLESAWLHTLVDSSRFQRVVRLLRLGGFGRLRPARLQCLGRIKTPTEHARLLMQLSFLMLVILILAHYVACAWVLLGDSQSAVQTWSSYVQLDAGEFKHRYAAALHWALSQFTPCTTNVAPITYEERIFATCIVLFAMVVFSSFISNMTTLFNMLRQLGMKDKEEKLLLRQYLEEHHVSPELGERILKYWKLHKEHAKAVTSLRAEELPGLSALPPSLKMRLTIEIYQPHLSRNPPLAHFARLDKSALGAICQSAIHEEVVMPLQDVFEDDTEAKNAYCVMSGYGRYATQTGAILSMEVEVEITTLNPWLADLALYIQWNHVGRLVALAVCQILEVNVDILHSILVRCSGQVFHSTRIFAVLLLQHVEAMMSQYVEVNDLMLPKEELEAVLARSISLKMLRNKAFFEALDPVDHSRRYGSTLTSRSAQRSSGRLSTGSRRASFDMEGMRTP